MPDIGIGRGRHPALLTLPWPFAGLSASYSSSNLSYFSFSNRIERETRSKEQRYGLAVRWTACGQTKSRWHWRTSWWPCCRSTGGNTCVCVCVCVHVHVCMCVCLGTSEVSFPERGLEKERNSSSPKVWGSTKQTGNGVPPSTHQEPEEGEKMCDRDWSCPLLYLQCVARGQARCLCPEMLLNSSGIGSRNLNHLNKGPRGLWCWCSRRRALDPLPSS